MGVILDNTPKRLPKISSIKQWMPYDMNNNRLTAERSLQNILDYLDKHDADTLVTATQIIIAPGYEPEALTILAGKEEGQLQRGRHRPGLQAEPRGAQAGLRHHLRAGPQRAGHQRRHHADQTGSPRTRP